MLFDPAGSCLQTYPALEAMHRGRAWSWGTELDFAKARRICATKPDTCVSSNHWFFQDAVLKTQTFCWLLSTTLSHRLSRQLAVRPLRSGLLRVQLCWQPSRLQMSPRGQLRKRLWLTCVWALLPVFCYVKSALTNLYSLLSWCCVFCDSHGLQGQFPALQVFGPLGASTVVVSFLLWFTQRRHVKSLWCCSLECNNPTDLFVFLFSRKRLTSRFQVHTTTF